MTANGDPSSLWPRPASSSYLGRVVLWTLLAAIVLLATALYLSLNQPKSHQTEPPEWPIVPSPQSMIINDTALVLSTRNIMWINLNDSPRESDDWWNWSILQVVLSNNQSEVGWYAWNVNLSLGVPTVVELGMGLVPEGSKENLSFSLTVADVEGNGFFDFGIFGKL